MMCAKTAVTSHQNRVVCVTNNLICSLITIRLATCFDPTGSSSDLLFEPFILESCVHPWDPNNVYKDKCKRFVSNDLQYVKNIIVFKTH